MPLVSPCTTGFEFISFLLLFAGFYAAASGGGVLDTALPLASDDLQKNYRVVNVGYSVSSPDK